jgi:hypothetical protein
MNINIHFCHISLSSFRKRNISDRSCRGNQNTHFVFSKIFNIVFIVFYQNGMMSPKIMFLFYLKGNFFGYKDVVCAYKITSTD